MVGSAAVHRDKLYLQITGTLPPGTLDTVSRENPADASCGAASLTVIAQLQPPRPGGGLGLRLAAGRRVGRGTGGVDGRGATKAARFAQVAVGEDQIVASV